MNMIKKNFVQNSSFVSGGFDKQIAWSKVEQIDLTPISRKLLLEKTAQWTAESVANAEKLYRRFLVLHAVFPFENLVPTKVLDEYWHQHILDTRKYAQDCEFLFGEFLHHDPYFGIAGEDDRLMNQKAFAWTQSLWESVFGEALIGDANPCKSTDCR